MPFEFETTSIQGVALITAGDFADDRGHFLETFREAAFARAGIDVRFVQINESVSRRGTLRGMHYQLEPHAQGKLVRVLRGAVLDVAVDLREGSPTFGEHVAERLDAESNRMMWIPPGFAHGFCALEDETHFLYMQTHEYVPEAEAGFDPLDPSVGIQWPLPVEELILSDKDRELGGLALAERNFAFS